MPKAIGIDIGAGSIKCALVDTDAHTIIRRIDEPTPIDWTSMLSTLNRLIDTIAEEENYHIGIAFPGLIDYQNQIAIHCPNISYINNLTVDQLNRKNNIVFGNDADLALYGEQIARHITTGTIAYITLGSGVGGAISIDGSKPGELGLPVEFGHIKLASNGRQCHCGGNGCLESYFSGWALQIVANQLGHSDVTSLIADYNQPAVKTVIDEALQYLAMGIANLIILFGANEIILNGKIANMTHLFLPSLKEAIDKNVFLKPYCHYDIKPSGLIDEAGIIGAAAFSLTK